MTDKADEFAVQAVTRFLEPFDPDDVARAMFAYFANPKWRPLPLLTTDDVKTLWELVEVERGRHNWHAQTGDRVHTSEAYRAKLDRLAGVLRTSLGGPETPLDGPRAGATAGGGPVTSRRPREA